MRSAIIATAFIATALADWGNSSAGTDKCAAECTAAHDQCVTAPSANMAECASEYAACLGYNPYEHGFVTPTACSKTPQSTRGPEPTKRPEPPKKPENECGKKCYDDFNKCRSTPGANMAYCSSEYVDCLGYNPFDGTHDSDGQPLRCTKKSSATPTPTPGPKPHHNHTGPPPPVHPTQPVIISGGVAMKPLEFLSFLAAGIAALL